MDADREAMKGIYQNAVAGFVAWTLVVAVSLLVGLRGTRQQSLDIARQEADAYISKDIAFRSWATSHGGVYVPPDADTPPNPYLTHIPERDIVSTTGKRLTLMNPAYMLRQMQSLPGPAGQKGRITSLKPLNPINAPDAWERDALQRMEKGEREVWNVYSDASGATYLRMMRPFITEKGCLKCHAFQGYKEGDIRGGIDVTIALAPYIAAAHKTNTALMLGHGGIWMLGLAAMGFVTRRAVRREKERQAADHALRESEEKFRNISMTAQDAILMMDEKGRVAYWNPAAEHIFGYSRDEAMQQDMHALIMPSRFREAFERGFARYLRTGEGAVLGHILEVAARRKDGTEFPVGVSISTMQVAGQRYAIGMVRDITPRKRDEEALKRLNQELDQRVREEVDKNREKDHLLIQQSRFAAMGEMVHNIAHQWRQPLTSLGLILDNLQDKYAFNELTEEGMRQDVARAKQLLVKMSSTIDDFRNFFAPNKAKAPFRVADAIAQTVNIVEASFKSHGIALSVGALPDIELVGYANEFSQVILNLLTNAKEALEHRQPADPAIHIECHGDGAEVVVEVTDNGGGIPEDVLPKIFDPYFTTKEKGSGIGLYMSRMIMEHMGGTIRAENAGAGARFVLRLPRAAKT